MAVKGILLGSILGAIAMSLGYYLFDYCVNPRLIYDGSYFLIEGLLAFSPQGIWLGAVTGYAVAAARGGLLKKASIISICGILLFLIAPSWFVIKDPLHFYAYEPSERWSQMGYYYGGGLLWAGLLSTWAFRLWAKSRAV